MTGRAISAILTAALLVGCDAADDVRVQPLPSLEASSPEARAGLPEIAGAWRFAGWELAPGDTARVASDLPGFGSLLLETQRLDSIAGFYVVGDGRMPLVGEVRRDSIVSLVGSGRYLTGRVASDTLWLTLTSLIEGAAWPDDARAAFVRSPVATSFVRVKGALPPLAVADSLALDSLRVARPATPMPRPAVPVTGQPGAPPPRTGELAPARPSPVDPREEPTAVEPPAEEEPSVPEPEVVAPRQQRPQPRLLGVPVDSSTASPTAARAIDRPLPVNASR